MGDHRASYDRDLLVNGSWAILRRVVGSKNSQNIDVKIRANIQPYDASELVGGILMTDSKVIMTPTQIEEAQWPGGHVPALPPYDIPQWVPRIGDFVIELGRERKVKLVKLFPPVNGEYIRIELTIVG